MESNIGVEIVHIEQDQKYLECKFNGALDEADMEVRLVTETICKREF